jgi:hypothetical protein
VGRLHSAGFDCTAVDLRAKFTNHFIMDKVALSPAGRCGRGT